MSGNNDDLEVYIYQGKDRESVPPIVEKLIIDQGVQVLPGDMCFCRQRLREVTLHEGLTSFENRVFYCCPNLLEIKIGRMVEFIGKRAFECCERLAKVEFEDSSSSPHQLRTIDKSAFGYSTSLQRIKLPSSVTSVGEQAFYCCTSLVEANLSTTGLTEISGCAFADCKSLQTVCLQNTLERICDYAFYDCSELVTVVVPLENSQWIKIGDGSFQGCRQLAVLLLPKDSTSGERSFTGCELLLERYGEDSSGIVAGLVGRFEDLFSIHRMCYDHSTATVQELQKCIAEHQQVDGLLVDEFGMTPFHILFSTPEPSIELLDVLLESLPNQILKLKDANDRQPMDYLVNNWIDGTMHLFQRTLQKWMIDRLDRWGATSWMEAIQSKTEEILAEDDDEEITTLCRKVYSQFEHYENVQATSILEMALWKKKLKSARTSDGSKRQALDRDECRCLSGSDVVIPLVTMFFVDK